MEAENNSNSWNATRIALVLTILLLVGSAIYLVIEKERRNVADENLRTERLKSESLLAEKLTFEKENDTYESELKKMTAASDELSARAKNTEALLSQALNDLAKNQKAKTNVDQLKKQLQKLQNERGELDKQIEDYKSTINYARGNEEQNKATIAALEMANKQLQAQVDVLKKTSLDNSLIQSARKNQKLTVKAKRLKQLSIEADIFGTTENISLSLTAPDNRAITPDVSELTISPTASGIEKGQAFYTSDPNQSLISRNRVEIIYKPKDKLRPGVYKIVIENNGIQIGSLQVKLR